MGYTPNFGFKTVGPGESFSDDNYQFSTADRRLLDTLLAAVMNHEHDGASFGGVSQPLAPEVEIADGESGFLTGGMTYEYRIAFVDQFGRESRVSDPVSIDMPDAPDPPFAPTLNYQANSGTLYSGTYVYMLTAYEGDDIYMETRTGPPSSITLPRGSTHGIELSIPAPDQPIGGWNIYRRRPGGTGFFWIGDLEYVEEGDFTFTDDGLADDCNHLPPLNSVVADSHAVQVDLGEALPEGYTWKIYRTSIPGQWDGSLIHHVVERETEVGDDVVTSFLDVGDPPLEEGPNLYGTVDIVHPGKVMLTDGEHVTGVLPASMVEGASQYRHAFTFSFPGSLLPTEGTFAVRFPFPAGSVYRVVANLGVDSVPDTDPVIIDVLKKGISTAHEWVSIFTETSTGNVEIPPSGNSDATFMTTPSPLEEGDLLRVDVLQSGGGSPSTDEDLLVQVLVTWNEEGP